MYSYMFLILNVLCGIWKWYIWICVYGILVWPVLIGLSKIKFPINKVNYYIQYVMIWYMLGSGAGLLIPLFLLRPGNVVNMRITGLVVSSLCHWMKLKISYEIRSQEFLALDSGAVIVSNHQSALDMVGMMHLWKIIPKLAGTSKKEMLYMFPFGPAAWLLGTIFLDRNNHKSANSSLNKCQNKMTVEKIKIWMCPEGTRNRGDDFLPFKRGAFNLAVSAQVPIIPLVYSPYYFIDGEKHIFDKGHMILQALAPIPTVGLLKKDVDLLIEKTRTLMLNEFRFLKKECERLSKNPKWVNQERPRLTVRTQP